MRSATAGKIWGLKTRALQRIYTTVMRPILTYGSMVWWSRVRYISRTELNKLQRLACPVITRVMRITPTAAMGVLLELPSLYMINVVKERAVIYRFMCYHQWKPKFTMVKLKCLRTWSMNTYWDRQNDNKICI